MSTFKANIRLWNFAASAPLSRTATRSRTGGFKTIIRYNWVEGGWSRQMDLVDNRKYKRADAYVYGNVIVQGEKPRNRQMIHWGG